MKEVSKNKNNSKAQTILNINIIINIQKNEQGLLKLMGKDRIIVIQEEVIKIRTLLKEDKITIRIQGNLTTTTTKIGEPKIIDLKKKGKIVIRIPKATIVTTKQMIEDMEEVINQTRVIFKIKLQILHVSEKVIQIKSLEIIVLQIEAKIIKRTIIMHLRERYMLLMNKKMSWSMKSSPWRTPKLLDLQKEDRITDIIRTHRKRMITK